MNGKTVELLSGWYISGFWCDFTFVLKVLNKGSCNYRREKFVLARPVFILSAWRNFLLHLQFYTSIILEIFAFAFIHCVFRCLPIYCIYYFDKLSIGTSRAYFCLRDCSRIFPFSSCGLLWRTFGSEFFLWTVPLGMFINFTCS